MTNSFLNGLVDETNEALTENAAKAFKTSKSALLDFFALGGALRNTPDETMLSLFDDTYGEDAVLALRTMFYFRDVRGGQGQRDAFRKQLRYLVDKGKDGAVLSVLNLIPEYGRWDDLYALFGTRLEKDALVVIRDQLNEDINTGHPSLLAKWLKSENTSSKESRALATKTRKFLDYSPKQYRKLLSRLRGQLRIVERAISSNEWDGIKYDAIPSKAMMQYRKAFYRHDENGYQAYLDALTKGEAKVNTSTLYPYEIVEKFMTYGRVSEQEKQLLEAQWKQLPDYTEGKEESAIVVADTSGSMHGTPMAVALSMAFYFAERANGPFKNHFISFSSNPALTKISGVSLESAVDKAMRTDWGMNTDVKKVFDLILKTAQKEGVSTEDVPKKVYIVSDMQFDGCTGSNNKASLFREIKAQWSEAGYEMPTLVFWNVDARNNRQTPMTVDDRGFLAVSGLSPSIFKSLMTSKVVSPYDLMLEVLTSDRYAPIKLVA